MFHQFYLTHCTYASSALERRRDEMAVHPLGYSVRSGSVKGPALREAFRRLERYVYYYLPVDTPPEEKEAAMPHTAPVRLFYFHSAEGNRVAGQVVYRGKDTAGRTGSYFAHVLAAPPVQGKPEKDAVGEILDVLRMWGAGGWEAQDGEHHAHDIPPLDGVKDLMSGGQPAIQDVTLVSFLTENAGGAFRDPGNVIPARWRRMPVERRQAFFLNALAGLLAVAEHQNAPLILVAEPETAALMFYGLLRFLPKNFTRNMSFSTYEPQPERVFTKMAATTFFMPEEHDLREEMYRTGAFVLNTFTGRMSHHADAAAGGGMITAGGPAFKSLKTPYVQRVFHDFLQGGMPGVDRYCANLESVGAVAVVDLDAMGDVETYVNAILPPSVLMPASVAVAPALPPGVTPVAPPGIPPVTPGVTPPVMPPLPPVSSTPGSAPVTPAPAASPPAPPPVPADFPPAVDAELPELPFSYAQMKIASSRMATVYLRRRLTERLAKVETPEIALMPLVGTARHSLLLELLGVGTEEPHVRAAMQFLVAHMQEAQFPLWLQNAPVTEEIRARVLERWVQMHGMLPAGCEFLWEQVTDYFLHASAHTSAAPEAPLPSTLPALLPHLDETRLRKIFAQAESKNHAQEFLLAFSLGISQMMDRFGATVPVVMEARGRLDALVQDVSVETLMALHPHYGNWFFANYPGNSEALGGVLQTLEPELPDDLDRGGEFLAKYRLLTDAQETLSAEVRKKVQAWQALMRTVEAVVALQPDPKNGKKSADMKVLDHACKEMTFAAMNVLDAGTVHGMMGREAEISGGGKASGAKVVMVAKALPKEFTPAERQQIARHQLRLLRKIAEISPGAALLPAEAWQNAQLAKKVESAFAAQVWSLKKVGRFSGADKAVQNRILIGVGGTCMGLVAAVLWFLLYGGIFGGTAGISPAQNGNAAVSVVDGGASGETQEKNGKQGPDSVPIKKKNAGKAVKKTVDEAEDDETEATEDGGENDGGDENGNAAKKNAGQKKTVPGVKTASGAKKPSGAGTPDEARANFLAKTNGEDAEAETDDAGEEDGVSLNRVASAANKKTVAAAVKPQLTPADTLKEMKMALRKEGRLILVPLEYDPLAAVRHAEGDLTGILKIHRQDFAGLKLKGGYLLYQGTAYPFGMLAQAFPDLPGEKTPATVAAQKNVVNDTKTVKKPAPAVTVADTGGETDEEAEAKTEAPGIKVPQRSNVLSAGTPTGAAALAKSTSPRDIPGKRYDLPKLADSLGLMRVIVELKVNEDGLVSILLEGIPLAVTELEKDQLADREEMLTLRREELQILRSTLKACRSAGQVSTKKQDENILTLAKFLKNQPVPSSPRAQPKESEYTSTTQFHTETENWRLSKEAREREVQRFLAAAEDEILRRESEIETLETEIIRLQGEQTPEEARVFVDLYQKSDLFVSISVPGDAAGGGAAMSDPFQMMDAQLKKSAPGPVKLTRQPQERPAPLPNDTATFMPDDVHETAVERETTEEMAQKDPFGGSAGPKEIHEEIPEEDVPEKDRKPTDVRLIPVEWSFSAKEGRLLRAGEKAHFCPLLKKEGGKKEDQVLGDYLVQCEHRTRGADGQVKPGRTIPDISAISRLNPAAIHSGSEELVFRLVFYPKNNDLLGGTRPAAFRTRWYYIAPVEEKKRYEIEIDLLPAARTMLRQLSPEIPSRP